MIDIKELIDQYSIDSIKKELLSNPFFGYDLGYSFGANVQIREIEVEEIESVKKYSGNLSGYFTLYLKTHFRANGRIIKQGEPSQLFDESFVFEGRYNLMNEKESFVEGKPSVHTNFSLSDQSEINIDSELPDFDILKFPY